tara:strand:+ start:262 stop:660 length:399 start_codon:yes stop_codon:yes gene_type:complete
MEENMKKFACLLLISFVLLFSGPVFGDEFDQFEEMVGGLKMTCFYSTANKNIKGITETHTWTYKNDLHIDGHNIKTTAPAWSVKKKEGKNVFIVDGEWSDFIRRKFYIDFDQRESILFASAIIQLKAVGVCR